MISGFTFVRHGVQYGYPFEESILSLLPLVDEMIVNVGVGTDTTLARVQALAAHHTKIKIIENVWDDSLRKDGKILAVQTDLAMAACRGKWGIYLQADEVLHEEDYEKIRATLDRAEATPGAEGVLFDYVHFYGDFSLVNRNPSAYRREVRAVRLGAGIHSFRDAQGFRRGAKAGDGGEKLRVIASEARIFHYGWVRPPEVMQTKTVAMDRLYHAQEGAGTGENYKYKHILGVERFAGTHPQVMQARVAAQSWRAGLLEQPLVYTWKDLRKVLALNVERATGWLPFEYKNYERID